MKDAEVGAFVRQYGLTSVVAKVRTERKCFKKEKKGCSKLSGVKLSFGAIFNDLVSGFHGAQNVNTACCHRNCTNFSVSNSIHRL